MCIYGAIVGTQRNPWSRFRQSRFRELSERQNGGTADVFKPD
ncbi:hypothetical protein [Romeriopsis navalis]|nr:hypothetical protein [Romeriopsis navalis]